MILITGATNGIGKAIALKLARENKNLWLTGRNQERMGLLIEELKLINPNIVIKTNLFDLNDSKELKKFLITLEKSNLSIEGVINNAGLALDLAPFDQTLVADIETVINTNVTSLFLITHSVIKLMRAQNKGHIINIGSTAGICAYTNAAVYCASKAAIKSFSDGIRLDLIETDIKVTLIQPGIVETDFSLVRFKGDHAKAKRVYSGIEALQALDIADAVSYVMNTPAHLQVAELTLMATHQGNGFTIHRKQKP